METITLSKAEAMAWLKNEIGNYIEGYIDGNYTDQDIREITEEMLGEIATVKDSEWENVAIEENGMCVSNINVYEA